VAVQPHYNLVSRDTYEGPLQTVAADAGLSAVPYFALAKGFLTGKYRPGTTVDSPRAAGAGAYLATPAGTRVLAALDEIAASRGAAHATVALAWPAARPTVAAPIASARNLDQLPELLAVADLTLTPEELRRLTDASA
jgi:aryl-alcohol dehydrogenase-like predicted oxidoreductase